MDLVTRHKVTLVAIGNGTASFETEEFTAQMIEKYHLDIAYLIVSEAGASVYSASKLAREELPIWTFPARSGIHCPPCTGPSGRACQNRAQGYWCWSISA